jgi:hypothetical protein
VQLPVFPDEGCVDKLRLMEGGLPGRCFGVECRSVLKNSTLSGEHPEFLTKRCRQKGASSRGRQAARCSEILPYEL